MIGVTRHSRQKNLLHETLFELYMVLKKMHCIIYLLFFLIHLVLLLAFDLFFILLPASAMSMHLGVA